MRKITNEELNRPSAGEFAAMEKMPVAVVLDNVRSLQNVGAFFRTGDAFAVERIALCGITATPPNRDIHKTALGAELTVPWTYFADTADAVAALRADGYRILCVEQAEGSVSLERWAPESGIRYALCTLMAVSMTSSSATSSTYVRIRPSPSWSAPPNRISAPSAA